MTDPNGNVLGAVQQAAQITAKPFPDLPSLVMLAAQMQMLIVTYGTYVGHVGVQVNGFTVAEASRPLWVVPPPKQELP